MRAIEASLTWQDGSVLRAKLCLRAPELGAPVEWIGDAEKIAELPAEIAPGAGGENCSIDALLAYGELHAQTKRASFAWSSTGAYDIRAE